MIDWLRRRRPGVQSHRFNSPAALSNMVVAVLTDIGNIRKNNEDAASVFVPVNQKIIFKKGTLLIVADGMGGHNSGEVASNMVINTFSEAYYNSKGSIEKSLKHALIKSNKAVYEASLSDDVLRGMGTTCTAIVIKQDCLYIAHVGDSRAYLFNEGKAIQLSKDHTLVQHKIDMGELTTEDAATHPERNVLTNALGTKPFIDADVALLPHKWDDNSVLLLCSDGLYEYISANEMAALLSEERNIELAAEQLIEKAKLLGGHDNITVLIASKSGHINIKKSKNTEPG